jgi:hypothetical protein
MTDVNRQAKPKMRPGPVTARERFREEVVVEFLLENSPVDPGVPMEPGRWTTATRMKARYSPRSSTARPVMRTCREAMTAPSAWASIAVGTGHNTSARSLNVTSRHIVFSSNNFRSPIIRSPFQGVFSVADVAFELRRRHAVSPT